jgi:hypothetical protein
MVDGRLLMVRPFLILLLFAAPLGAQCPDGSPPPCRAPLARVAAAAAPLRGSIAVLPFSNRSADSSDAYLAEELPEQITGRLSRINQLRVEWLVTGSLRRAGAQLSAGIELVRTATAEQAWSAPFRRSAPRTPCSASLRTWQTMHVSIFTPLANEARFQRLMADTRPRIPWL